MALEIAVVKATTPTTNTTLDFTVSGFGTPVAAMFFLCWGDTDDTVREHNAYASVGFTDGTNQRAIGLTSRDAVSTSDTSRGYYTDRCIIQSAVTTGNAQRHGTFSSWVTDGVRLDWVTTFTAQMKIVCVLIKGCTADVGDFTAHATQNSAQSVTGLSSDPEVVFAATIGSPSTGGTTHTISAFGCANKNGGTIQQRCTRFASKDAVATMEVDTLFDTDAFTGQLHSGSISWSGDMTDMGTTSFECTTRDGGSGNDKVAYLALGDLDGVEVDLQTFDTATSTGAKKYTTSFQTAGLISAFIDNTSADTVSGGDAICFGAAADGAGEESVAIYDEDGASQGSLCRQRPRRRDSH